MLTFKRNFLLFLWKNTIEIESNGWFFFFSREETRKHIHVYCEKGEAKIWLEPKIEIARNYKLQEKELHDILEIVKDNKDEIIKSWKKHFKS